MITKQVTITGEMQYDEEQSAETAWLMDYRTEVVTKGTTYTIIDPLPYDFIIQNLFYRVTQEFDGTVTIGTAENVSRVLAAADFVKTVGKKSTAKSIQVDAGKALKLYMGAGNTGKIEVHITGFLLKPSLL